MNHTMQNRCAARITGADRVGVWFGFELCRLANYNRVGGVQCLSLIHI